MAGSKKVRNQLVTSLMISKIRTKRLEVKIQRALLWVVHNLKCTHFFNDTYFVYTTPFFSCAPEFGVLGFWNSQLSSFRIGKVLLFWDLVLILTIMNFCFQVQKHEHNIRYPNTKIVFTRSSPRRLKEYKSNYLLTCWQKHVGLGIWCWGLSPWHQHTSILTHVHIP